MSDASKYFFAVFFFCWIMSSLYVRFSGLRKTSTLGSFIWLLMLFKDSDSGWTQVLFESMSVLVTFCGDGKVDVVLVIVDVVFVVVVVLVVIVLIVVVGVVVVVVVVDILFVVVEGVVLVVFVVATPSVVGPEEHWTLEGQLHEERTWFHKVPAWQVFSTGLPCAHW